MAREGAPPLPEDVSTEILSRLPVKSLLRLKLVCKHWRDLIQNPNFVTLHRNHHHGITNNNDCLFVKRFLTDDDVCDYVFSLVPDKTPVSDLTDVVSSTTTGVNVWDLDLFASCNGVVCIANNNCKSTIALCNPSMREIRLLPQPRYHAMDTSHLGFGLDPITNDYKVVRVATSYDPFVYPDDHDRDDEDYTPVDVKVEIYNLSTDCWREIDPVVPTDFQCDPHHTSCTSLNGVFYWFAVGFGQPLDMAIIGFRMSDELFEQIPFPHEIRSQLSSNVNLFTLNDALAFTPFLWGTCGFDIWVMDGYGVEGSWNKKYTIGPFLQGGLYPLLSRRNGEFLLFRWQDNRMVSYELNTGKLMEYEARGMRGVTASLQVLPFTESLVSVKRLVNRDSVCAIHPPLEPI